MNYLKPQIENAPNKISLPIAMTDTQNGPISENGNKLINPQIFFEGNRLKTIGDYVVNKNLAKTFQAIVRKFGPN